MRLSTLFAEILGLSIVLFIISLLTSLSYPAVVNIIALQGPLDTDTNRDSPHGASPQLVSSSPSPSHCHRILSRTPTTQTPIVTPPWNALLAQSNGTIGRLFVYVWAAQTRRLGNQLFNYASLFGIAWRNQGVIPLWPDAKTYLRSAFSPRIPIDQRNAIITSANTHFVKLREPGWAIYGPKTEQLPSKNHSLTVFLQSWKYFIHAENQLRLDLSFRSDILDRARRFMEAATPLAWRDRDFLKVVIHIRRGDYNTLGQRRFGWAEPQPDYFNLSMAYYCACHPRVLFVVLGSDQRWARSNVVGKNVVYSSRKSPTDDMAIASLCDHAIITIGSFGWWVAWFAGGVTITQKNFPTPGSPLLRKLSRQDYYKPEWVAL